MVASPLCFDPISLSGSNWVGSGQAIGPVWTAALGPEADIADYECLWQLHPENGHWIPASVEEKKRESHVSRDLDNGPI